MTFYERKYKTPIRDQGWTVGPTLRCGGDTERWESLVLRQSSLCPRPRSRVAMKSPFTGRGSLAPPRCPGPRLGPLRPGTVPGCPWPHLFDRTSWSRSIFLVNRFFFSDPPVVVTTPFDPHLLRLQSDTPDPVSDWTEKAETDFLHVTMGV